MPLLLQPTRICARSPQHQQLFSRALPPALLLRPALAPPRPAPAMRRPPLALLRPALALLTRPRMRGSGSLAKLTGTRTRSRGGNLLHTSSLTVRHVLVGVCLLVVGTLDLGNRGLTFSQDIGNSSCLS